MSSKNSNKKSDDKNDKEEQALKEAEIVAELAPDEKTRKEAEQLIETVETQDSSEIFDIYKKGILKITEELSKFQPQFVEMISKLQEEYLPLTKQFVDRFFAVQRNWAGGNVSSTNTTFPNLTYTSYAEQFRRQSDEITAQALKVYDTSNQLAINTINAARENMNLYRWAMESMMAYNNNMANAWSAFLTPAQRQQYFRQ